MKVNRHTYMGYPGGSLALKEVLPGFFEFEPGDGTHYQFHRVAGIGYIFSIGRDFDCAVAIIYNDSGYLHWIKKRSHRDSVEHDETIAQFGWALLTDKEIDLPSCFMP